MLYHFIGVIIHFELYKFIVPKTQLISLIMKLALTLLTIASLATTILSQEELSANDDEKAICEIHVRTRR